jgi:succinate dehydrogenase/fumarate reductase flavoprotein subunit
MCVSEFASNRSNRLGGKIGVRLIVVGLLAGEYLAFNVMNTQDARAVIRQQATGLQVTVSVNQEWLKQAIAPRQERFG